MIYLRLDNKMEVNSVTARKKNGETKSSLGAATDEVSWFFIRRDRNDVNHSASKGFFRLDENGMATEGHEEQRMRLATAAKTIGKMARKLKISAQLTSIPNKEHRL